MLAFITMSITKILYSPGRLLSNQSFVFSFFIFCFWRYLEKIIDTEAYIAHINHDFCLNILKLENGHDDEIVGPTAVVSLFGSFSFTYRPPLAAVSAMKQSAAWEDSWIHNQRWEKLYRGAESISLQCLSSWPEAPQPTTTFPMGSLEPTWS